MVIGIASFFSAYYVAVVGYSSYDSLVGCYTADFLAVCSTVDGVSGCISGDYYCSIVCHCHVHGILFHPGFLCFLGWNFPDWVSCFCYYY